MRLLRALIISIVFHILLAIGAALMPVLPPKPAQPLTIVELLESPESPKPDNKAPEDSTKDEKQIVRSAPVPPELLTDEKKEKRFASEEEQNVLEEQKARASGLTANRSGLGANEQQPQAGQTKPKEEKPPQQQQARRDKLNFSPTSPLDRAKKDFAEKLPTDDSGDVRVGGLGKNPEKKQAQKQEKGSTSSDSRPLDLPTYNGAQGGQSTVGEALPDDIKFGDFTALNTDRHLYYSFYSRMEEKIRHRWVTYARAALYSYQTGARSLRGNETWTTRLEVILDPQGNFVRAVLKDSSGIQGLDSAPVQAFRDAKQFPNPPQEMVKKDGAIHIEYAFSVNIAPAVASGGDDGD